MTTTTPEPNFEVRGTKGSGAGRRLHALRSFAPGELITAFDDPILGEFIHIPYVSCGFQRTHGCFIPFLIPYSSSLTKRALLQGCVQPLPGQQCARQGLHRLQGSRILRRLLSEGKLGPYPQARMQGVPEGKGLREPGLAAYSCASLSASPAPVGF